MINPPATAASEVVALPMSLSQTEVQILYGVGFVIA